MAKKSFWGLPDSFFEEGAKAMDNVIESQKAEIRDFLKNQDVRDMSFHLSDSLLPEVVVDVKGTVGIRKEDLTDKGYIPFKFGKVSGSFVCRDCGLTSLDNAPDEVGDVFCCSGNNLESLRGCPKKVGITFECESNAVQFTQEDIKEFCKVGGKVKTCTIKPVKVFESGYEDFPTKTKVDKFRFTTFDSLGLGLSFHISSSYMKGKTSLMDISYWTKYGSISKNPKVDGLDTLSKDFCDKVRQFVEERLDKCLQKYKLEELDWNNWDIPTSEKAMIEGGYPPLEISIPDHPSLNMESLFPYAGDGWLNGTPVFELKVNPIFYK